MKREGRRIRFLMLAIAFMCASAVALEAAEVHFRCDHESAAVKKAFKPGDRVPLGGYEVDIGWMGTYTEDAWIIEDPSCDPLSTLALVIDGTDRVGEVHGEHTDHGEPGLVYAFKVQIGAERTDVFGARFGAQTPDTGFQFWFVQFGGDGTIWVMGESTGIPYRNVFASDCGRGIDNRIKVGWKMNLADGILHVTVKTFGPGALKATFGPYPVPEPLMTEGWHHCIYQVPPETGRYYFDGVRCEAESPPEFDPVPDSNRTRR